ncbi:IS66 family transposase [Pseudoalteromonas piscicida]|uniref:IS66 family transposase n=1 Tax=Pseudoalteromonas piscicida TaxID=43662 RepID=A0AAD0RFV5_PSEO7|nr:IS66 family transposase [Pseudoalteromonas piscicida]ASD67294.1 IS66 family transposase [Pseudoalteromonas piscicida]ASD67362.1 IS66 family transposase [Pseudoalteromonas piscicida]ASD69101.1 IS66 family transposase [Pseudoalteromonas piscicida]AXR01937.1 IS66 family transposase [Pseudoalteromonas piscicida]AXR02002.1 IS66 family transposase [Pseudoalteromonas piscicida]
MQNELDVLRQQLAKQEEIIAQLQARNNYLEEQFILAQQKRFGASSESHPAQADLFNEAETLVEEVPEQDVETIEYQRKKPTRQPLPKDLPRERVVHDIDNKQCGCCGGELHKMGEDVSEKLEFIPAQVKVIEHVRPKYSCRQCEKTQTQIRIVQAPVPPSPIPKGIATASLLSQIITSKYQYGLPLYRQESLFKQYGIALCRRTMADWMIRCASLFKPLYDRLHDVLLQQPVIQADETTVKVVKEDKQTNYMWLYCSGTDSPAPEASIPNIALFDYQNSRAGRCPVAFLKGYNGYLQVDGYAGYEQTQATLVGCWAHARRKFKEAADAQAKGKTGKANWALNHIQKLYRVETAIKGMSLQEKQATREKQSTPLLAQFKTWLEKSAQTVVPKSKLGEAIHYTLRQWPKLIRYLDDGHLKIDNNRAERAIKPFVIGRKNWLFSFTTSGAESSAILYSVIETARANGLTPFDYVMHCLNELAQPDCDINSLLPWNVKL